jgi:hypothetical protein
VAQNLGNLAQQRAVFRSLAKWFQRPASQDLRRNDNLRFRPGEKPDGNANQGQEEHDADDNPYAVLFPKGRRHLGVWRTKERDFAVGRVVGGGGEGWLRDEQRDSKGQSPKAETRSPKEGRNPKSE